MDKTRAVFYLRLREKPDGKGRAAPAEPGGSPLFVSGSIRNAEVRV